jgi:hypothetical protein
MRPMTATSRQLARRCTSMHRVGEVPRSTGLPAPTMPGQTRQKGHVMSDASYARQFAAYLPSLAVPVRIITFSDAQVFVRRWSIRDKDPAVRELVRRMAKAHSADNMDRAMDDLKRELGARGMLYSAELPQP